MATKDSALFDASSVAGGSTSTDSGSVDLFSTGKIGKQKVTTGVNRQSVNDSSMSAAQMAQLRSIEPSYPTSGPTGLYHRHTETTPVQASVDDLIKDLIGKATGTKAQRAEFEATQKKLFEAGLYGTDKPGDVVWGVWTDDTRKAAMRWYTAAAQQNKVNSVQTAGEWLDQAAQSNIEGLARYGNSKDYGLTPGAAVGGSGKQQKQVVNRFTDPQLVAAYAQQAAQTALNRNLSNKELKAFVDSFHEMEAKYNQVANNDTAATVSLAQPDAGAQAQQFIDQKHPNEVAGERMAGYASALESMLGSGS